MVDKRWAVGSSLQVAAVSLFGNLAEMTRCGFLHRPTEPCRDVDQHGRHWADDVEHENSMRFGTGAVGPVNLPKDPSGGFTNEKLPF